MNNLDFICSAKGRRLIKAHAKMNRSVSFQGLPYTVTDALPEKLLARSCDRCGAPYEYKAVKCEYCGVLIYGTK